MEIGGIDIIVPFACNINDIISVVAKYWPNYVLEDCEEDYFLYKSQEAKDAWDYDYPVDNYDYPVDEYCNEMIYVLFGVNQTTLVIESLEGDVKAIVEEIHGQKNLPRQNTSGPCLDGC